MAIPFDIILMVSNYSHDIATAFLAVSGLTMWIISKEHLKPESAEMEHYFPGIYRSITRMAKYSLAWILLAGVPRIVFYTQYEWSDMAGELQVVAIIIKHIVMFLLVGMGLYYWSKLDKRIKSLKLKQNA